MTKATQLKELLSDIDCYMLDELLRLSRRLEKLDSLEEVGE